MLLIEDIFGPAFIPLHLNQHKNSIHLQTHIKTMSILKSTFAFAMLAIFSVGLAIAQPPADRQGPPMPDAAQIEAMMTKMSQELSLSSDQQQQVQQLFDQHFKAVEEKMANGRPERSEMKQLKDELDQQVNAVLSEEQQALYEKYKKENRPQRGRKERREK
ncbi:hypothetical protein PEPS_41640 (plasmid) [Persicobacter psychrovividus]|uniref:LTXXQ motif family protein n=2 Tax=Persicobacter psychrovividus TaxID=387638 RepID=A0ABM7VLL2_9BACT|nr:hypothetical protein PEPS_41640 [Persicobacter psychrovividus]